MLLKKPEIIFDPSKKEHRSAVRSFLVRKAWVDSPIRFAYDPEYGSVSDQVQDKLLRWYMNKENAKITSSQQLAPLVVFNKNAKPSDGK